MNPFMRWRVTDSPKAWWSLRLLSQNVTGLFFTSALKYLRSVPEVGLVKICVRRNEPQILPHYSKVTRAAECEVCRIASSWLIGSLPGSCVPAVHGMEGSPQCLVDGCFSPCPFSPWALREGFVTTPAWRTVQRFSNWMQWVSWTWLVLKMIWLAVSSLLFVYRWKKGKY